MTRDWWYGDSEPQVIINANAELEIIRQNSNIHDAFTHVCRLFEQVAECRLGIPIDAESAARVTMRTIIESGVNLWGQQLWQDLSKANRLRNRLLHRRKARPPTEAELVFVKEAFLTGIQVQLSVMLERLSPDQKAIVEAAQAKQQTIRVQQNLDWDTLFEASYDEWDFSAAVNAEASMDDPHLRVGTVAESVFCARAAVLADEGASRDSDPELPSLATLPWYELDAIIERQTQCAVKLFWWMVFLLVMTSANTLLDLPSPLRTLVQSAILGVWVYFSFQLYCQWSTLGKRQLAAKLTGSDIPIAGRLESQEVNWWSMLGAGFESTELQEAWQDDDRKISGRPKRVLRRGSIAIPVHRVSMPAGPLRKQHVVRAAAYCHLLMACEAIQPPYAIIFFRDSYDGITVPNTQEHRQQFYDALKRCRRIVAASKNDEYDPPQPRDQTICKRCPNGAPELLSKRAKTTRYGKELNAFILQSGGRQFNCRCGDRFSWKPPHRQNRRLEES